MKRLAWILVCLLVLVGCQRSQIEYDQMLTDVERLIGTRQVDSALTLLGNVELSDLPHDSLRVKYSYFTALAHMNRNRSMVADSLIGKVHEYYRGGDKVRDITSGTILAYYRFWTGDTPGAISLLDSIIALPDVPDTLMVKPLRIRTLFGAVEYHGERNIPYAKRLISAETDTLRKIEAKYLLANAYEYAEKNDSALTLIDELIDYAKVNSWGDKQFQFEMDRAQLLSELGRYDESDAAIAEIFRKAPNNGASHYLLLQKAVNAFNRGGNSQALALLAKADSAAVGLSQDEDSYYNSFSRLLRTMVDYKTRSQLKMIHLAIITNRQQERFNRMKASQWESERSALRLEARSMALRAESERKTGIILVVVFVAIIIAVGAVIIVRNRRRKEMELEERSEALRLMVEELKSAPVVQSSSSEKETLRRAMMQHLGIIRMVAETPTESNRDMLRRMSSIENDSADASLVNWSSLYDAVDTLYDNFHHRLHQKMGDKLSDKEEQIIVLMVAGFSTKEIGVITSQSAATIYVRKSSIRKKLGIPQKEDIVAFVDDCLKH